MSVTCRNTVSLVTCGGSDVAQTIRYFTKIKWISISTPKSVQIGAGSRLTETRGHRPVRMKILSCLGRQEKSATLVETVKVSLIYQVVKASEDDISAG